MWLWCIWFFRSLWEWYVEIEQALSIILCAPIYEEEKDGGSAKKDEANNKKDGEGNGDDDDDDDDAAASKKRVARENPELCRERERAAQMKAYEGLYVEHVRAMGKNQRAPNGEGKDKDKDIEDATTKWKHLFLLEKTPLGNVLMQYDAKAEHFTYFSDTSIPYRFLETVARKFVKTFRCRELYIDMEEELRTLRLRHVHEQCAEQKQSEGLEEEAKPKKSVFAKLKSYNKQAGAGPTPGGAGPARNNLNNPGSQALRDQQLKEEIQLKQRANRFHHEGKLANFSFLQKVKPEVVNQRLTLSFADFQRARREQQTPFPLPEIRGKPNLGNRI